MTNRYQKHTNFPTLITSVPYAPQLLDKLQQYDHIALLLQGGGALGAYQAGIYEGLYNQGISINSISGISIGALNTAIIAGNHPEDCVDALKSFWNTITQSNYFGLGFNPFDMSLKWLNTVGQFDMMAQFMPWLVDNGLLKHQLRMLESSAEAFETALYGQQGFFRPRHQLSFATTPNHLSYYTIDKLKDTLASHCCLDLINRPERLQVTVSAVNVRTGNFEIFCNADQPLRFEHFMASGALPPGFPAVEIQGEYYWDGGMVSNTPLNEILNHEEHLNQLIFQVDLWDAKGIVPENMLEIDERIKDIQYSSKTRMITDLMKQKLEYNRMINQLVDVIQNTPDCIKTPAHKELLKHACQFTQVGIKNVIQLIYHSKSYQKGYKDYEFSRKTMLDHWQSGLEDIQSTFAYPQWFDMPEDDEIFITHDIHRKRRELSQAGR